MEHGDHDDSEEERDEDGETQQATVSLTGFLFGNIDKKGQLIDDVLDEVSIYMPLSMALQNYSSLCILGTSLNDINCSLRSLCGLVLRWPF